MGFLGHTIRVSELNHSLNLNLHSEIPWNESFSILQISQYKSNPQFDFVPRDTEESQFLDLVDQDFGV